MKRTIVLIGVMSLVIGVLVVIFSLVSFPFVTQEPYDVPKTSTIISESFTVPVGDTYRTASLNEGDLINIYFRVTSGGNLDVDFLVMDLVNYLKWEAGESYSALVSLSRATSYNNNITIPQNATCCFVWDNSFSWITQKGVTTAITKHWNEIAYRDVTVYHTVIPSEYATYTEYLGIGFIVVGVFVTIWGAISKPKKPESSQE